MDLGDESFSDKEDMMSLTKCSLYDQTIAVLMNMGARMIDIYTYH